MKQKILDIINSTRFWALVFGALAVYGKTKGWIGESEMMLLDTIFGGHILLNTADRFSAKSGNTTVSIPSGVSSVQASKDPTPAATGSNETWPGE